MIAGGEMMSVMFMFRAISDSLGAISSILTYVIRCTH
jgi:hypothetical protein